MNLERLYSAHRRSIMTTAMTLVSFNSPEGKWNLTLGSTHKDPKSPGIKKEDHFAFEMNPIRWTMETLKICLHLFTLNQSLRNVNLRGTEHEYIHLSK